MMNSYNKTVLVATLASLLSLATVEGQHSWTNYGPTDVSCGTWTTNADRRPTLKWWVSGFVSGASRELALRDISLTETDPKGLEGWITKYCADHPLDGLVKATVLLVDELKGAKGEHR